MLPLQRPLTCSSRALMSHRSPQLPWLGGEANPYKCGASQWPLYGFTAASSTIKLDVGIASCMAKGRTGARWPRCLLHKL